MANNLKKDGKTDNIMAEKVEEQLYTLTQIKAAITYGISVGTYSLSGLSSRYAPLTRESWIEHEL